MSAGFEIADELESTAKRDEAFKYAKNGINGAQNGSVLDATKPGFDFQQATSKYEAERAKRMRIDGTDQYIPLKDSKNLAHFSGDPWVEIDKLENGRGKAAIEDGSFCQIIILGAGFGGILAAVGLVRAGISPDDICIVDSAGGFGGTWYWNRYPGLMCDIESYLYLPLLEDMGYIPKHKYSYGGEIRQYINLIVNKYGLRNRASFETTMEGMTWDEEQKTWSVDMRRNGQQLTSQARFVYIASGALNHPKVPNTVGIDGFKGALFHTSRWNYDITGGSQADPSMTKLQDKVVGVLGTGATAVQAVPELARWAKKVYVFQRTPAAVDWRGQHKTDPVEFRSHVATGQGWQEKRMANFRERISNWPDVPDLDLVSDSWSSMPSYKALIGGPNPPTTPDAIPSYISSLHELDFERQERIRQRISKIVENQETAEKLKPWYPGFCKRPGFHDDYIESFNLPNVELVDTDGKGVDRIASECAVVNGKEYPLDILILGTGYHVSTGNTVTTVPAKGRRGRLLSEKFEQGWNSLHGLMSRDFPNAIIFSLRQTTNFPSFTAAILEFSRHAAYIISEVNRKAPSADRAIDRKVAVEPTEEAEEAWTTENMKRAGAFAAMPSCTPSYLNAEGSRANLSKEERVKASRIAPWGGGLESYTEMLEDWRRKGDLPGLEITF